MSKIRFEKDHVAARNCYFCLQHSEFVAIEKDGKFEIRLPHCSLHKKEAETFVSEFINND